MKKLYFLPFLVFLFCACNQNPAAKQDPASEAKTQSRKAARSQEWIQLFNGEDLDGWTIKMNKHPLGENYKNTFRVEDGMLVTRYDEYETFEGEYGHIFYKNHYSHYKLLSLIHI